MGTAAARAAAAAGWPPARCWRSGVSVSGYDRPDRADLVAAIDEAAPARARSSPPRPATSPRPPTRFPWVASVSVAARLAAGDGGARDRGHARRRRELRRPGRAGQRAAAGCSARRGGTPGVGWLRLPRRRRRPAGTRLPDGDPPGAGAPRRGADPEVGPRVRAAAGRTRTGALGRAASTAGRSCGWGRPERMAAKAAALGLVLADLPRGGLAGGVLHRPARRPSGRRSAGRAAGSPRTRRPPRRRPRGGSEHRVGSRLLTHRA